MDFFQNIAQELDNHDKKHKEIEKIVEEIKKIDNDIQIFSLYTLTNDNNNLKEACFDAMTIFLKLNQHWIKIKEIIEPDFVYRYLDIWEKTTSSLVTSAIIINFFINNNLLTIENASELLGFPKYEINTVSLQLEDYLFGVCGVSNILIRFCINSVTNNNFTLPKIIKKFAHEIFTGLQLLNLKNNNLRRKYDSMKYDIQKIDEVVYDLTIRKFNE